MSQSASQSILQYRPGGDPPLPSLTRTGGRVFSADSLMRMLCGGAALSIILMLLVLLGVLLVAAIPSMKTFGFGFLVNSEWRPNELERPMRNPDGSVKIVDGETAMETIPPSFGALAVIYGTVISSIIALGFAVPLSLGAAMFLVRIAPKWLVTPASILIEFLAAIPSIAFGLWGLFILAPFLQAHIEPIILAIGEHVPGFHWLSSETIQIGSRTIVREIPATGRDMLCGGLILGIMILPIITAVARDVLRAVPRAQIEGALALGATWWQSAWEMLRYSRSGLFGAIMLGLARAAGETMAITMVIGNNNQIRASLVSPAQTMSSLLANEFAEASTELHRSALIEVALVLLVMSLLFNITARWLVVGKASRTSKAH
jgi:phosphate transport system permease protein